jgi:hypothetical protein
MPLRCRPNPFVDFGNQRVALQLPSDMTGGEPGWQEPPEEPGRESSLEELRGYAETIPGQS